MIHKQLTALPTKCRTNASKELEEDDNDVDGVRGVEYLAQTASAECNDGGALGMRHFSPQESG